MKRIKLTTWLVGAACAVIAVEMFVLASRSRPRPAGSGEGFRSAQPSPTKSARCTCEAARRESTWCDACGVGYVATIKIPSRMMFDVLDYHGHDIDPTIMTCASCRKAIKTDGFCEACRIGYVREQAYFSVLTYRLAKGVPTDPARITCSVCRGNLSIGGWCDACKLGMVGNVSIGDRAAFDQAYGEFRRLLLAISHLDGCESCAVARFTNGMCPWCRISYRDGRPVSDESP